MKKILAVLLILAIVGMHSLVAIGESDSLPALGDVNQDTLLSADDALVVLQHMVGKADLDETSVTAGDVDGNTKVDSQDALWILKKVVGKIQYFPMDEQPIDFTVGTFEIEMGLSFMADHLRLDYSGEDVYIPTNLFHCKSTEQLKQIIRENKNSCEEELTVLEAKYSEAFFADRDLLLLCVQMPVSGGATMSVKTITKKAGHLDVKADITAFGTGFTEIDDRMYFLELPQKTDALGTGKVTYSCYYATGEQLEESPQSEPDEILVRECEIQ